MFRNLADPPHAAPSAARRAARADHRGAQAPWAFRNGREEAVRGAFCLTQSAPACAQTKALLPALPAHEQREQPVRTRCSLLRAR